MSCGNACFSIIQAGIYLYRGSGSLLRTWFFSPHSVAQNYALMAHFICNNHALKFRIGHRMVCGLLRKAHNLEVNGNTVQRIMQKFNIQYRVKKKRQNYLAGESKIVVPNILNREFTATKPNEKWVADITYLPYGEKMIYLSAIMDLYNNEILAYTNGDKQDEGLVLDTLKRACEGRNVYECILHSDQGSQYTSYDFQEDCKKEALSQACPDKEIALIRPSSNPSTLV